MLPCHSPKRSPIPLTKPIGAPPAARSRSHTEMSRLPTRSAVARSLSCTREPAHEALDIFAERYEELRRDRPDDFTVSREDYGRGFYS